MNNLRCDWSDLPVDQCAHCTGAPPLDGIQPDPRRWQPAIHGRRVDLEPDLDVPAESTLPTTWGPVSDGCRCGRPTRDDAYVCDDCGDLLARALGDIPWTVEQLDISISGQRSPGIEAGGGNDTKLWHLRAADTKRNLHSLLVGWVRWCIAEHVRNTDPHHDRLPVDNLPALSRWMLWRIDGLALHEAGPYAVEQIVNAVNEARRIILWKRRSRVYLGRCEGRIVDDGTDIREEECPGEVYAEEGFDTGECIECHRAYPVAAKRGAMEKALDDRLYTAQEIARLSTHLGLDVPRERVRNQINTWQRRGRILPHGEGPEGQPLYRYGDVSPLLYAQYATRETVSQK